MDKLQDSNVKSGLESKYTMPFTAEPYIGTTTTSQFRGNDVRMAPCQVEPCMLKGVRDSMTCTGGSLELSHILTKLGQCSRVLTATWSLQCASVADSQSAASADRRIA